MSIKNWLFKFLLAIGRPKKSKGLKEHFLVVSTTGLGDTLWGTPAIKALREKFPNGYIAVLTSPVGFEVLETNPHVDEIFVVKNFSSYFRLFFPLKKRKIQTALIFHTSQRPIIPFAALIGASVLIGTKGINKGLDDLLTHPLQKKPIHEIARRLEIVEAAGAAPRDALLAIYPSDQDKREADEFLKQHQIPDYVPLVGIHPGSKDVFKRWDPECFIEVANRLHDHLGCQIFITGNQSEQALIASIASKLKGAIAITGSLSLRALAALIQKMSLMITNDTGPMHIAFAMQTPTIALFSPTDSKLCGPYAATRAKVIEKKPTCTPCLRKKCREPFCLLQIGPTQVYNEALKLYYAGIHT